MNILGINGSPRKNWNTSILLNKSLEGATSQGANTELINLYDLNYKGCISCFACKTIGSKSYGKCPINDDLKAIFKKVEESDAIILGSPIYNGTASGEMHSFMERLLFQYSEYSKETQSLFPKKIHTGFIYTMNATEKIVKTLGFDRSINFNEFMLKRIFGYSETLLSFNTSQFDDYSKVVSSSVDLVKKARTRKEQFPEDCKSAFEMGVRFARDKA